MILSPSGRVFWGVESRTAADGGGEGASREGPHGGAPREGNSCALEEHCPTRVGCNANGQGVEDWRGGSLEVEVSLKPLRPVV
jgi:hypothetical protein